MIANQPKRNEPLDPESAPNEPKEAPGNGPGPSPQKGRQAPKIDPDEAEKEIRAKIERLVDRKQRDGQL